MSSKVEVVWTSYEVDLERHEVSAGGPYELCITDYEEAVSFSVADAVEMAKAILSRWGDG